MNPSNLGPPSVALAGLRLWIHGRQFPDAHDRWDGNWLQVTAGCEAHLARVFATGPILMVTDLVQWRRQVEELMRGSAKEAQLEPLEPELSARIETKDALGHLALHVTITPDHLSQSHSFEFEIDQSYLPALVSALVAVEHEYPPRGLG